MLLPLYYLKERGFQLAIIGSVVWHFFWLFGVQVNEYPHERSGSSKTRIYFLGPVLTDEAFNMIVSTKPELSETLYRSASQLIQTLEPEIENLSRHTPGDLVSIPFGQRTWHSLRGILEIQRQRQPSYFYEKFSVDIIKSPFPLTGDLAKRDLFYLPQLPRKPDRLLYPEGITVGPEALFEITVNAKGEVTKVENIVSTGNPEEDLIWNRYLKDWQFMPFPGESGPNQKGQLRVGFSSRDSQR